MSASRTLARISAAAAVTLVAACAGDAATAPASAAVAAPAAAATLGRDLAAARAATARYHRADVALADGYVNTHECVAIPGAGMGVHFVHGPRVGDGTLDPARPEVLVYEPQADGALRLVAVEYMIPRGMWDATSPGARPMLFGHAFEDGPMDSYTLHAWVWRANPQGMFAAFNPQVRCPATSGAGAHASHH